MKAVTSAYDRNDRSTEKLTAQNKVLTKQIDEQRSKVEMLRAKLEESAKEYGETDERTVEWQRSLNRATAALNKSELQLESNNKALASSADKWKAAAESAEAASKKWQDAGKAMSSAGDKIVTAATAAAAAIGALVIGTASYADEILTTSVQTGIATDELQKYGYAAELVDVEVETLTKSMAKNIKSMKAAQDGTKLSVDAYEALGVSVMNTDGTLRDGQTVYWEIIDALGQMENETERDSLAMQLLGKSAQDLNPLIKTGSARMRELGKEAEKMGYIMSGSSLEALGEFDDQLQRLKLQATAAKNELALAFLPTLTRLTDKFSGAVAKLADKLGRLTDEQAEAILKTVGLVAGLGAALSIGGRLTTGVGNLLGAFSKLATSISTAGGLGAVMAGPAGWIALSVAALATLGLAIANAVRLNNELFEDANNARRAQESLTSSIEYADEKYAEESTQIAANAILAEQLTMRLEELGKQTSMTAAEKAEYAGIVAELNEIYPELNLSINEETALVNQSTAALLKNIQAMKQKAIVAAIQERLTEKIEAYVNATIEAEKAEIALANAEDELAQKQRDLDWTYSKIARSAGYTVDEFKDLDAQTRGVILASSDLSDEYIQLQQDVTNLNLLVPELTDEKGKLVTAVEEAEAAINSETEAVKSAMDALDEFGELGANAGQALADGLLSKEEAVRNAAKRLARTASKQAGMTLEVRSPSRVFKRLGAYVTEGFALGMDSQLSSVASAAKNIAKTAMTGTASLSGISTPAAPKPAGITLNIQNFTNNSDRDIEALADTLNFYTQRKMHGGGRNVVIQLQGN